MPLFKKVKGLVQGGAEAVSSAASAAWDATSSAISSVGSLFSSMSEATFGRLFTTVDINAFLLPTGSDADEYVLHFDFEQALEKLRSGVLVRPRLIVYAGREDMDRELLAHRLNRDFTYAFGVAKTQSREAVAGKAEVEFAALDAQRSAATERGVEATSGIIVALIGLFLASNPIVDIVFLLMAVFGGKKAIRFAYEFVTNLVRSGSTKNQVRADLRDIEKQFGEKEGAFEEAVSNLRVHIEVHLARLCKDICEVDLLPYPPCEVTDEIPAVESLLSSDFYRSRLDEGYHALLG